MPAAAHKLSSLFSPKSIAIIGASSSPEKIGNIVVKNVLESGYTGSIYPVNPKLPHLYGQVVYKDVLEIPEIADVAVLCVPISAIPGVLEQIVLKGIKNIVVFTAGFKEAGKEGAELEKLLLNVCEKEGINMLGPNCLGFFNAACHLNLTFTRVPKHVGNLRFISQSGAIASALFDFADSQSFGFDQFITVGNKAILDENAVLDYLLTTYGTSPSSVNPLGLYLESLSDGQQLMDQLSKITQTTPVFMLKPGRSLEAQQAMLSHTGSLAGSAFVTSQALSQVGVIECHNLEDLFDLCQAEASLCRVVGPNTAIVSNAGGPGVVAADLLVENNLSAAVLSDKVRRHLAQVLPRSASIKNPIDILGDALSERYAAALELVLQEPSVDNVLVLLTPQTMTQIEKTAAIIKSLSASHSKPIFCAFVGGTQVTKGREILAANRIPSFHFPVRALWTMGQLYRWHQHSIKKLHHATWYPKNSSSSVKALGLVDSLDLCSKYNLSVPDHVFVSNLSDAWEFAQRVEMPVVLKSASTKIIHKSEKHAVILNVDNYDKLSIAYKDLHALDESAKILVQKQVGDGIEILMGIKKDSTFGYVAMFGAGGVHAELIADRNLLVLGSGNNDFEDLIEKSKVYKMLNGFRGGPVYELNIIYQTFNAMCTLLKEHPEITEIEINPVIVNTQGTHLVDVRIIV